MAQMKNAMKARNIVKRVFSDQTVGTSNEAYVSPEFRKNAVVFQSDSFFCSATLCVDMERVDSIQLYEAMGALIEAGFELNCKAHLSEQLSSNSYRALGKGGDFDATKTYKSIRPYKHIMNIEIVNA